MYNLYFSGSVIVFTSVLSVLLFRRNLSKSKWLGIILTTFGVCVVGIADVVKEMKNNHNGTSTTENATHLIGMYIN